MLAASKALVDRWTPRRICSSVSKPKNRSTWLIQDADDGDDRVATPQQHYDVPAAGRLFRQLAGRSLFTCAVKALQFERLQIH
jgi:hypothetical protein